MGVRVAHIRTQSVIEGTVSRHNPIYQLAPKRGDVTLVESPHLTFPLYGLDLLHFFKIELKLFKLEKLVLSILMLQL